jgi:hypothetical protein
LAGRFAGPVSGMNSALPMGNHGEGPASCDPKAKRAKKLVPPGGGVIR